MTRHGQGFAALGAAALKSFAAGLSFETRAKAMLSDAFFLFGLPSTFRHMRNFTRKETGDQCFRQISGLTSVEKY